MGLKKHTGVGELLAVIEKTEAPLRRGRGLGAARELSRQLSA